MAVGVGVGVARAMFGWPGIVWAVAARVLVVARAARGVVGSAVLVEARPSRSEAVAHRETLRGGRRVRDERAPATPIAAGVVADVSRASRFCFCFVDLRRCSSCF